MLRALGAALVLLAVPSLASEARLPELSGAWHVLVHYTDSATRQPEQPRWDDRLWVFEPEGDTLVWTEYAIVAFDDESGRFEALGGNRASRVLGYWEPNAEQRGEIRAGLAFNPRGRRRKTLHGSPSRGWSSERQGGYRSARVLTYHELWEIQSRQGLPVFRRQDVLGGAGAESLEGLTLYETESMDPVAGLLSGRFERDGTRSGRFRMTRSGSPEKVPERRTDPAERVRELFFGEMAARVFDEDLAGEGAQARALRQAIDSGDVPDELRDAFRTRVWQTLAEQYRAQGNDPRSRAAEIDGLARHIEVLYLDEGRSLDEIRQRLRDGRLRP